LFVCRTSRNASVLLGYCDDLVWSGDGNHTLQAADFIL